MTRVTQGLGQQTGAGVAWVGPTRLACYAVHAPGTTSLCVACKVEVGSPTQRGEPQKLMAQTYVHISGHSLQL